MKSVPGIIVCVLVMAISLGSCDPNEAVVATSVSTVEDPDKEQKVVFAKALARAVAAEPAVRSFLKQESQKMIDEDFDVVYALVRDVELSNGRTLRETLLPFFSSPAELTAIEERLPLLTIFVPTLPNATFSARDWDVENQVPDVAIRVRGTNEIPIVNADGHQILLEPSLVPGYPVIVVKTNERMITEKQPGFRETESTRTIKGANGLSYKFTDDLFDRSLAGLAYREEKQKRLIKPDAKLKAAYDIYKKADGWQRDYIYYGITPGTPNGEFSYDYKEYISSFYVTGDAFLVYQRMAEQSGDPFIKSGKKSSGWADGFFEVRCTAAVHGQNGVGTEIKSAFLSKGSNLFDVVYHVKKKGIWPFRYDFYEIESVTAKQVLTSMPLVNWDLESYASTFRIDVEEADNVEVIKTSRTENVEFATNFDVQATILKVGLKFGASRKRNVTSTIEVTTTLESDYLGQATVNFADKVITEKSVFGLYMSREYYNDIFSISIEPRHIQ